MLPSELSQAGLKPMSRRREDSLLIPSLTHSRAGTRAGPRAQAPQGKAATTQHEKYSYRVLLLNHLHDLGAS